MSLKISEKKDFLFYLVNDGILFVALIVTLYPLIYVVSSSFSSPDAVAAGHVWLLPVKPSMEGYRAVFTNKYIATGYGNTIFYTVAGTALNVSMTLLAAYPLSRKDFMPQKLLMFLFTFTMIFNGGMIPNYLLNQSLGFVNTRWVMILPGALTVWNVIITRTFFQYNLPDELLEAAQLDGCSDFSFAASIALPLSRPIIAVITLFYAVEHWNAFFDAFLYLRDRKLFPLQIVLRDILIANSVDTTQISDPTVIAKLSGMNELLKYSLIVVASVPVMCMYPLVQKHFVKGVMVGAIKG